MNIFQFIDQSVLKSDELQIEEGKRLCLEEIQLSPLRVDFLKKNYGDRFSLSLNFVGKTLVKVGVDAQGKSFAWCGEKTITAHQPERSTVEIELGKIQSGTLKIFLHALEKSIVFNEVFPVAVEKTISPEKVLYDFLFPTYELCCEEALYYRFFGETEEIAFYSFEDKSVHLKNASVDCLTYFNAFSAVKWKKYTNVEDLALYLDFIGEAKAELIHIDEGGQRVLAAWQLLSNHRATLELPLGKYPPTGLIGLHIHAKGECILYGGGYLTNASDTQNVRLGIGITTYQREEAVKASVARLGKAIAAHPLYQKNIALTVVDNGQSLFKEDIPFATLIPSRNLGGTGGFMRSLIHYQDEGWATHCLFMDDDAACEAGSIFRSVSFMRHAKDGAVTIAAAMLSETCQFEQWESGAYFDGIVCRRWHGDYDLRSAEIILKNEHEDAPSALYGGWWFFMFPIQYTNQYSFPFFVRGDDVAFSYLNPFKIVTLNGVASWQASFRLKESPFVWYLNMRGQFIHHMLLDNLITGRLAILKMMWSFFYRFNCGYQYDTANAIACSFSDVILGPKYWVDNMDMQNIRSIFKNKYKIEVNSPLRSDYKRIARSDKNIRFPFFTKFIRRITLNGHLFPRFMAHKKFEYLSKDEIPFLNRVFLKRQILVIDNKNNTEFILRRNTGYFVKNIIVFIKSSLSFIARFNRIKSCYVLFYKDNKSFWRSVFNERVEK